MNSPFQDRVDEIMSQLRQQHAELAQVMETFESSTVSALSKDRMVEVTLLPSGQVKAVKFHRDDYIRMAPAQLSAILVETLDAAFAKATEQAREMFGEQAAFPTEFRESLLGGAGLPDLTEEVDSIFQMLRTRPKPPESNPRENY
ncbi:YbaB/EbfC family nucleoid-associated protein [Kineosporia rhizophila]|uniref:YbaB/EbfC family nucleoid-associated protein n=1 Tax=Kineosporia rhizophila TaxID=84633 RepID=UPI000A490508|nr:YbaB/EbfC family nucleoid-associated protein [Kineosporia rhizophila]MCE0537935.1 YbaB/EbfC family nucleoid-associated protein [Kineosporia rhizophila]